MKTWLLWPQWTSDIAARRRYDIVWCEMTLLPMSEHHQTPSKSIHKRLRYSVSNYFWYYHPPRLCQSFSPQVPLSVKLHLYQSQSHISLASFLYYRPPTMWRLMIRWRHAGVGDIKTHWNSFISDRDTNFSWHCNLSVLIVKTGTNSI